MTQAVCCVAWPVHFASSCAVPPCWTKSGPCLACFRCAVLPEPLSKLGSRCHQTPCSLFLQDLNKLASPGIVLHKDSVTLQSDLKGLDQVKNYYRVSARAVCPETHGAWQGAA